MTNLPRAGLDILRRVAKHNALGYVLVPVALAIFLAGWQLVVDLNNYPPFILPSPAVVAQRFVVAWNAGTIPRHGIITLTEALAGFTAALIFASVVGYTLAKSPLLEKIVSPYLVASQSLPIVAIAPLILIWVGTGFAANALLGALVAFFPMLVNTIVGVRSVNRDLRDLMRSFNATRWQMFALLELPAALPIFFGGIRVGIALAVIGVVVVELVWADRGLGFLINSARGQFDTPLLFATLGALSALTIGLYILAAGTEKLLVRRKRAG